MKQIRWWIDLSEWKSVGLKNNTYDLMKKYRVRKWW